MAQISNRFSTIFLVTLIVSFISCVQEDGLEQLLDSGRETFNEISEDQEKNNDWDAELTKIYNISDTNISCAINYADSLLNLSLNDHNTKDLLWIKGELFYNQDNINKAYDCFYKAESLEEKTSPRSHINMASCLVLMDQEDESLNRIKKAIDINQNHNWYLGNYYEILGNKKLAIEAYSELAGTDKVYNYYDERIEELQNDSSHYSKFVFRYTRLDYSIKLIPID